MAKGVKDYKNYDLGRTIAVAALTIGSAIAVVQEWLPFPQVSLGIGAAAIAVVATAAALFAIYKWENKERALSRALAGAALLAVGLTVGMNLNSLKLAFAKFDAGAWFFFLGWLATVLAVALYAGYGRRKSS